MGKNLEYFIYNNFKKFQKKLRANPKVKKIATLFEGKSERKNESENQK